MLAQLNDCTGGLLHLGPNVITFRTLLHLGQLLHLGLQHHRTRRCSEAAESFHSLPIAECEIVMCVHFSTRFPWRVTFGKLGANIIRSYTEFLSSKKK